jgi:hypothetical protein
MTFNYVLFPFIQSQKKIVKGKKLTEIVKGKFNRVGKHPVKIVSINAVSQGRDSSKRVLWFRLLSVLPKGSCVEDLVPS